MSSNGDPVVSVVVVEDAAIVIVSDDSDGDMKASAKSKRKRQKHQFSWEYVKDWQDDDSAKHCRKRQCIVCHKWYSRSTNALGWKAHMKSVHGITSSDTASFAPSSKVDVTSLTNKSILLMILDVKCGIGVSKRVGTTLFENLKRLGRDVVTHLLNVVNDNGSNVTAAIARLFQLVNTFIGYKQMCKVNHVQCADHYVQLVVLKVLTFIKEPTEQLRDALIRIRRSKVMQQQYRVKAAAAGLASKKPTHQDSPMRWNSTHDIVREPANPQANRLGRAKARRRSRPQFAAAPLLSRGELSPEHRTGSGRNSLFVAMFQSQRGVSGNSNKVDQYLLIGIVQSSRFIDILSWWSARKELLSGHYQMAMDYHGTPATSTPSEQVNSADGCEFTCT
ncbi:unnamed protein product [Sphagnum balticum]